MSPPCTVHCTVSSTAEGEPAVILLAGLQGAGKTTAAGKLAKYCKERLPLAVEQAQAAAMAARGTEDEAEAAAAASTAMAAAAAGPAHGRVLLVAGDIYRPAAIEQLQKLGESVGVDVFTLGKEVSPVDIVTQGLQYAKDGGFDTVIVDTAGRQVSLHFRCCCIHSA